MCVREVILDKDHLPTNITLFPPPEVRLLRNRAAGDPIAVLPADMPFVTARTVKALLDLGTRTNALVSPRLDGRRGHPLIVPADLRKVILAAPDHAKLNEVLKPYASRVVKLDVEDRGVVRDVDVVGDLEPAPSEAGPVRGRVEGPVRSEASESGGVEG